MDYNSDSDLEKDAKQVSDGVNSTECSITPYRTALGNVEDTSYQNKVRKNTCSSEELEEYKDTILDLKDIQSQ
jgi:hypothetical protein